MKKKILIIEDDVVLQEAIKTALTGKNYDIIQSFDGDDGTRKAEKEKPDLILLDLMLPKKDGYHVLRDMKEGGKLKETPIIILTVIDSKVSNAECKLYGAADYIVKSENTISEIVEKIEKNIK